MNCNSVFKTNFVVDGSPLKYKKILVANGFYQVQVIDYNETFSSIAKMEAIRLGLAIVASTYWEVHHMDVKSAFRNGDKEEDIYIYATTIRFCL